MTYNLQEMTLAVMIMSLSILKKTRSDDADNISLQALDQLGRSDSYTYKSEMLTYYSSIILNSFT